MNTFFIPKAIHYGDNVLEGSADKLRQLGAKALVVSDSAMSRLGNVGRLTDILGEAGISFSVYDEVDCEPTDILVNRGVEQYRREGCDFLIAIGGGSPIDAMKAIAAVTATGKTPAQLFGSEISGELPPMVAVPTTAGTGSEATQFTIITDSKSNVKMLLKGACLLPHLAIIDPAFTLSAPATLTAFTGLDALCHAVEAYTSRKAQPLSDTFALSAVRRILTYLPIAYGTPGNREARTQMCLAATEAGIAFNNASVTIIHGMSRPIGAQFHVPHGLSNAMIMERCLAFAQPQAQGRFAEMARHCALAPADAADGEAADALMAGISSLIALLNIPSLEEYGVSRDEFNEKITKMASDALESGSPANTLRPVSQEDIISIYHSLWE